MQKGKESLGSGMLYLLKSCLSGEVHISGSKNAFFPAVGAGIAVGAERIRIRNVPRVRDVFVMLEIVSDLGGRCVFDGNEVAIYAEGLRPSAVERDKFSKIRGGVIIFGAMLARFGRADIPLPGGCQIGKRPIDQHIKAARELGFEVEEQSEGVSARGDVKGRKISFDLKTVTGTENAILMAIRARSAVEISNCAEEPEVQVLMNYLEECGVRFEKRGDVLIVDPTRRRDVREVDFELIPDRIEAGTFLICAAATEGHIRIKGVIPTHLETLVNKLKEAGAELKVEKDEIEIKGAQRYENLYVIVDSYPGFPTDLQPQLTVMLLKAKGKSVIEERVFPERMSHVYELRKMGADIEILGNRMIIHPGRIYGGRVVEAKDLRGAASLVIAGLVAEGGPTAVKNFEIIERGYENFLEKISGLRAKFYRDNEGRGELKDASNTT